jgi:nicotinate-nucleotide--dimethylbenzimidazole phosphoribosyltransferase
VARSMGEALEGIEPLDEKAIGEARARQDQLTKPQGSLGRLEELAIQIAGIRGQVTPVIRDKAIIVMAADHGVVVEGVSAYPQEVTAQMVDNFLQGKAAISVLARQVGARVVIVDMGIAGPLKTHRPGLVSKRIGPGTHNLARGFAMSRRQAIQAIEAGIEILEAEQGRGLDIVGAGDMGIGNTTASSAICAAMTGVAARDVAGRGAGLDQSRLAHKVKVIEEALSIHRPDPGDPLGVLAALGGFEIAGLVGLMIGAAFHRLPVVIDGFISGAAALIASCLAAPLRDYLIASHVSAEPGHRVMLRHLGLTPLLDLELRLGEGTGAALGIFLAEAATKLLAEMATFSEAGVSRPET